MTTKKKNKNGTNLSVYLSGNKLYGDDFSLNKIRKWYEDEKEGYADIGAKNQKNYRYVYHALNRRHGYSKIVKARLRKALGIGSAYGDEFLPIINRLSHITIIDPSDAFSKADNIEKVPCLYLKPRIDGKIILEDRSVDLITCFGVLHHVPNVSALMQECGRVLRDNGFMLLREPIVSMGDWNHHRAGLTKRERGIPLKIFKEIIRGSGLHIRSMALCVFSPLSKIMNKLNKCAYDSPLLVVVDEILCRIFAWNITYHRTNIAQKLGPSSVFFVLAKKSG